MAERVGFEPTIPVKVCPLSRRIVSTTHAPLRVGQIKLLVASRWSSANLENLVALVLRCTHWLLALLYPPVAEKALQHFRATTGEDASLDLHPVIQLRVIQDLQDRVNRACLGVVCSVDQALDPRVDQSAGTHRARFNCSKQLAVSQTMVADNGTRLVESNDFSMSGGVIVLDIAVPAFRNDFAPADDDRTYGNLACLKCTSRSSESSFQKQLIGSFVCHRRKKNGPTGP